MAVQPTTIMMMPPEPDNLDDGDDDDVPNPPPRGLAEPDPSLRNIVHGVPDDEAIDAVVPEVRGTTTDGAGDREGVTHVVMR